MESRRRTRKGTEKAGKCSSISRGLPFGLVGLAVVVAVAVWSVTLEPRGQGGAAPPSGGPRLAVDKRLVDFGTVRFESAPTGAAKTGA